MSKQPRSLSDGELSALKTLWRHGAQTAGEVREHLNRDGRAWAYTTTKTILDRLEEKGYVRRKRTSTPHVYVPIVSPEMVAQHRLGAIRRELFDGSRLPLIRALVQDFGLKSDELAELRALLDAHAREEEEKK